MKCSPRPEKHTVILCLNTQKIRINCKIHTALRKKVLIVSSHSYLQMTACLRVQAVYGWDHTCNCVSAWKRCLPLGYPAFISKTCSQAAQTRRHWKAFKIFAIWFTWKCVKNIWAHRRHSMKKRMCCWILCTQLLFLQVLHTCHYDCKNAFERRGTELLQQRDVL